MGRKSLIPEIERKRGKPIEDILIDLVDQGEKVPGIVKELGIRKSMVYDLLNEFDLKPKLKTNSIFQSYLTDSDSEFMKLIDDFLITKEVGGKTPPTIIGYRGNLNRYAWWLNEVGIPLQLRFCFVPDVLRRFLHYVQTLPIRFGGNCWRARKSASRSTVDSYYRTFSTFGTWLKTEKKIHESPIEHIEKPGQDIIIVPDIPDDVLNTILNSFDDSFCGKRDRTIFWIFLDSGIRLAELVGIELSDVNPDTGFIKVFGKGRKERMVRIGEVTRGYLADYLKLRKPLAETDQLFITAAGTAFSYNGVRSLFTKFKARFPDVPMHAHAFRHKFALEILRNSGNLAALKKMGGWADLNMPLHYAAALEQEDALKVHELASPADNLAKRNGDNHRGTEDEPETRKSHKNSKGG